MIYCDSLTLQEWIPPLQDMPLSKWTKFKWTKLFAGDTMLSNCIESADWQSSLVQPIVCESCGHSGCAQTGLARIANIGELLIWVRPNWAETYDGWLREQNAIQDSVMIPTAEWNRLCRLCPSLPRAEHFPLPTREDLMSLWLSGMPSDVRVRSAVHFDDDFWRKIIASDPLDLIETRRGIMQILDWVRSSPQSRVNNTVLELQNFNGVLNSVFFDGRPFSEWIAFEVGSKVSVVIDNRWVIQAADSKSN